MNAFRGIFSATVLTLTIVAVSTTAEAQKTILWQGAVKPEQINVYTSNSTSAPATAMLRQGDVVDVVLEVTDKGNAWCRIGFSGQSEPLGYVLCFNLEQGHFTSQQIAQSAAHVVTLRPATYPASATPIPTAPEQVGSDQQSGASAADRTVRVYISDSQSWEIRGGWGASGGSGSGYTAGGARPQTAEIIKTFGERCPDLTVTSNKDKANYAVVLDHEGGKGLVTHHNKIAVFNREGDSIFSHSTVSLGNSVKDACEAIRQDAQNNPQNLKIVPPTPATIVVPASPSPMPATAVEDTPSTVSISSNPDGAEIYADDSFVGNTPASLKLRAGRHSIMVKANGYRAWSRDLTVPAGSEMRLIATLEKAN